MDTNESFAQSLERQAYEQAEIELCDWLNKQIAVGLPMTAIVFMLQFRIFDINQQTILQSQMIGAKAS